MSKKLLNDLIEKCDSCKFATCENCEINWTEVQAVKKLLNLYEMQENKLNDMKKYIKELREEWSDISLAQSNMEYTHKELVEQIESILNKLLED